jgi:hypothetical protein
MAEDPGIVTKNAPASNTTKWFMQDGQFTKTGASAVLGNFVVLFIYFVTSLFSGVVIHLGAQAWTIPSFDVVAAAGMLALLNGTYLGGNMIKNNAAKNGA